MNDALVRSRELRRQRILASPRYSSGRFHNSEPSSLVRAGSMLSTTAEYLTGGAARRPPAPFPLESPLDAWRRAPSSGLRVTWLGHSTTLVEIGGRRVLTDPVWSDRISPVPLVGPRRFQPAPVAIDELSPIDVVIVSHDHYDHLDAPTIRRLATSAPLARATFYTPLGVGERLEDLGVAPGRIVELDWWETVRGAGDALTITATPARHFSGRSLFDRDRTLWSSWVIASDEHRVFFSGDTGLTNELATIGERHGPFDLVMLEIGAFHPAWGDIHLGPDNALVAHEMLGGGSLLPIHWGTFDLALHAWDQPIETLVAAAAANRARVVVPPLGRAVEPAHAERIDPWWRLATRPSARQLAREPSASRPAASPTP